MDTTLRRGALRSLFALPLSLAAVGAAGRVQAAGGTTMQDQLATLAARQEIADVLNRYARGWDRLDEAALRSCFFDDATHQHGAFKGRSQDFITASLPVVARLKGCTHVISNVMVEVVGDRAVAECYFFSHHRRMNAAGTDEEDRFLQGRYLDRFERRGGAWRIAHRRGLHNWERVEARADQTLAAAPAEQLSQRKPDDPLYVMLAELRAGS